MQCASCGSGLLEGRAFCHVCGAPAGPSCPRCHAPVGREFAFCPDCGLELSPASSGPPARQPEPGSPAPAPGSASPAVVELPAPRSLSTVAHPSAPVAGERKQVTVLFCDLEGSTAIAENMDPEEYRDLLGPYLELAIREIDAMGGAVNQLAGDGFMALFGAPVALECWRR